MQSCTFWGFPTRSRSPRTRAKLIGAEQGQGRSEWTTLRPWSRGHLAGGGHGDDQDLRGSSPASTPVGHMDATRLHPPGLGRLVRGICLSSATPKLFTPSFTVPIWYHITLLIPNSGCKSALQLNPLNCMLHICNCGGCYWHRHSDPIYPGSTSSDPSMRGTPWALRIPSAAPRRPPRALPRATPWEALSVRPVAPGHPLHPTPRSKLKAGVR